MFASSNAQRFMIWCAIIGAVIYGVACVASGFFPPPSPALDAASVVHLYADHNIPVRIGVVVCIVAAGWSLPWTIAVSVQMAREETGVPIWSILQFGAGLLGVLIFALPPIFWGIAAFSVDRDPALTLLMHETAFLFLVTPASFFPLQALPVGIMSFSRKRDSLHAFPRWLGFMTIWMMATAELGVLAQLFRTGPFAWNGVFAFWLPIGVFAAWFTAINYCLFRAIKLQRQPARAS